ncbi:MAG: sirohydrochlorin cobaltochelatase [Desulfovibrionaceae bacterium]
MKQGIVLAAFGAGNDEAQRVLHGFGARVCAAFPGVPVRWAFTSGVIRTRLADEGRKTDSVNKALQKMWYEKFTHVVVQSLHVVPGREYNDLLDDARALASNASQDGEPGTMRFARVGVGAPLLASEADVDRVADAVVRHVPAARRPDEAVLLMGHGTRHQGDAQYGLLSRAITCRDPNIFIGTMDGAVTIKDIIPRLLAAGVRRAYLLPLLAVAGAHVRRDMAGTGSDSWASQLVAAGIACTPVLKGAAEYEGFAAIWIDHLHEAVAAIAP